MKVPKKIQEAIIKCAKHNNKGNYYENIIYEWLEINKLTEETATDVTRNMDDSFIDCCKTSYNPDGFIRQLETVEEE